MKFCASKGIPRVLFLFFVILYFWNLGGFSLASWDEAWYGSVSKNIIEQGNWLTPSFNGELFLDHPPFGLWLQAAGQFIFGFNEFGVRLPGVIWGMMALIFTYQIAKKWGGTLTGITAIMVLGSAVWFVLRVRSGNLDIILTANMLGSLYWALKTKENQRYLPLMLFFLLMTVFTKSVLGFGMILICSYWLLPLKKSFIPKLILGLLGILSILFLWGFAVQYLSGFNPLLKILRVGTRTGLTDLWGWAYIENNLFYLHMGVEKWYYPMILALISSFFSLRKKEVQILWLWLIIYLFIFLFNRKTELWHLIPAYPALALLIGLEASRIKFLKAVLFLFILIIFLRQSQRVVNLVGEQKGVSVEAALAGEVKKYPGKFYFDNENIPVAVYYSDRKVYPLKYNPPPFNTVENVFDYGEAGALVITKSDNLKEGKRPWREIKKINNESLVVLGEIH